ncbi:Fungal N-terminal domain-containing protein [Madurella fahalii]|uniref:Fungal N-terminal domain-containing protein n=1 Tax=Madurella fahalii TaxID=1157608 RepID=A0ABQ0GKJ5_9PEZI
MSGLEILGAASTVLGLVESAISLAARLREARQRQKGLAGVLDRHAQELVETQRMVALVRNEEALQTAAVAAELVALEVVAKSLVNILTRIQTSVGDNRKQRGFAQFFYQLAHGSRDEADLRTAMEDLGRVKADLGLCISVAHVGLSRGMQDTLVLNTHLLERVDSAVRAVVGDGQGLLIGKLARGRPVREDGTVVVTGDDLASLHRDGGGRSSPQTAPESNSTVGRHIVTDNMTAGQALQINGPVGAQEWHKTSHLLVRDNKATGQSMQINASMSMEAFSALLRARQG